MSPPVEPCLSVVMPCYNEAATVKVVLERVLAQPVVREVIVVDDGSGDDTLAIARSVNDPRVQVYAQPVNLGKGAALRRGFRHATSPYVIVQDADLEYDPVEYTAVLRPLLDGNADVVYGSRFAGGSAHRVLYFWHSVGNKLLTTTSNMFTNLNLTDMETCYKAFRREVLDDLEIEEDRFGFEPEITAKLAKGNWRVYEVGIPYAGRTYAEGKKIGWRDGVRAMYGIIRYSTAWDRTVGSLSKRRELGEPAAFDDADEELAGVLHSLQGADNYADWILDLMEPHLGPRILEIGAGHGEITERLAREGRRVTATELSERSIAVLRGRFANRDQVEIVPGEVSALGSHERFDTIVLVNVLEHIPDDERALREAGELLVPGGRLVIFSPALGALYSEFDRRVGHRRRYKRSQLVETVDRAGLQVLDARYVNSVGAIAWWVYATRLGCTPTAPGPSQLFDRFAVPFVRRREDARAPRFGQSVLLAAEKRVE